MIVPLTLVSLSYREKEVNPFLFTFWTISLMQKLLIVSAISALFATAAFAAGPSANANGNGGASVNSNVNGYSYSVNGGFSQSGASNQQSATVSVTDTLTHTTGGVDAVSSGYGSTTSSGYAYNLSSGNANGGATSEGYALQVSVGSVNVPGVGAGNGSESSGTFDHVEADKNQGAAFAAQTGGGFSTEVSLTDPTSTKTIQANTSGYSYANTENWNGVYVNGNSIDFGGNSNQVTPGNELTNFAAGGFDATAHAVDSVSANAPIYSGGPDFGGRE